MTRLTQRFDDWTQRGPFTQRDLGVYRIIFAVVALFTVPDITWTLEYPSSFVRGPLGPFRLLSAIPPSAVLIGLEVARTVALVILGLGLWTRITSWLVSFLLMICFGISYSLDHLHHSILLVVTPMVLSFADWGSQLSLDARRSPGQPAWQKQWPLRLLAMIVGLGFFTAAVPKLLNGWLSPALQMNKGYFYLYSINSDSGFWLEAAALNIHNAFAWKSFDWFTVVLECAVLATVPWWRAFRITLAVATLFHLGIFLLVGIAFSTNVIAYGAFVSWGTICLRNRSEGRAIRPGSLRFRSRAFIVVFVSLGVFEITLLLSGVNFVEPAETVTVFLGAGFGVCYLLREGRSSYPVCDEHQSLLGADVY